MEVITKYEVKEIVWPGKTFVTKRAITGIDKLPAFFNQWYRAIYQEITNKGLQANEPPCAIYYWVDEEKNEADLAAAVPVKGNAFVLEEFEKVTIPKSKALLVTYYGPYENMASAYLALEEYVSKNKLKKEWMLEEYFSDPAAEKDPAKWKTNIYFIVK